MGTMISLALNGVDIDWGKNRSWSNHRWLFPPNSLTEMEYEYAYDITEIKAGFETTMGQVRFRLRHLGYSDIETEREFTLAVARWNRTASLRLRFADYRKAIHTVDFSTLTREDIAHFEWDFRRLVLNRLNSWDTDDALLEDFIFEHLDVRLMISTLASKPENERLLLRWHHQDLIESGWATQDDFDDIDRSARIIDHTRLVGRIQDKFGLLEVKQLDNWLEQHGVPRDTEYVQVSSKGAKPLRLTLPVAVRHMIHHPENPHSHLTDSALRESIERLLAVLKVLPPMPGL